MIGLVEQVALVAPPAVQPADEADKEKKKQRRRPSRRAKPTPGCGSVNGVSGQSEDGGAGGSSSRVVPKGGVRGRDKACNVAFNSLPNMPIEAGEGWGPDRDASPLLPLLPLPDAGSGKISKSCPLPGSRLEDRVGRGYAGVGRRKCFDPHWSEEAVNEAIEKGDVFRAVFRVNAYNHLEAYCTVDGVPVDVLISGAAAQNRAIEGDVVAIMLDPVTSWTRLKGSAGQNCNSILADDFNVPPEVLEVVSDVSEDMVKANFERSNCDNSLPSLDKGYLGHEKNGVGEVMQCNFGNRPTSAYQFSNGYHSTAPGSSNAGYASEGEGARALRRICTMISSYPSKRPTGRVLAIIEPSRRRDAAIGFLSVQKWISEVKGYKKDTSGHVLKKKQNYISFLDAEYIQLIPTDAKFPEMVVSVSSLPDYVRDRLSKDDLTVEMELIAAQIVDWSDESLLPQAHIIHIFGRGVEIEPQIAAILFENAICNSNFSPESLSCLPNVPWKIPLNEFESRKDLRNLFTFTIDPSSAIDLDDALSVDRVSDGIYRVGVHIADVSYFVLPDTALDTEAQIRSTSVYILQHKLPMLPPLLSEQLGSLIPSVDRLALSIMWDISLSGNIVDQWIGRSIIRSCCKLSYEHAQDILDGSLGFDRDGDSGTSFPALHGQFEWKDLTHSIRTLNNISKNLKENRLNNGALWLDSAKLHFLFDECGNPFDSVLCERKDSNFIVEEFMLLANKTAAEVISRTFPDCALLRRHPEPNLRKLKEFKAFCSKHGFELEISSSSQLHLSLLKIRESLKNDPILFDILVSYASRPMQLATYFCTGDFRNREDEWAHYALAVPLYTHFTSPLRRYPDILVHRTLLAALEAEEMYMKQKSVLVSTSKGTASQNEIVSRCFTGIFFDKDAAESKAGREALSAAVLKYKVPVAAALSEIVSYCNERRLAGRHAEEAGEKVYMWALLRKRETQISEARVMGLGPRFMSVYIHKLAIERRIYYSEVKGLVVEWLETTSTLVLDLVRNKHMPRRNCPVKFVALEHVALVMNPLDLVGLEENNEATQVGSCTACVEPRDFTGENEIDPAVFPLTLRPLSTLPVVLHAVGGDDGPLDIGVRLYMSSYFR